MAVKWYLLPKDTSWENYWEDISIEEQAKTTENDCPELLEAILKFSNKNSTVLEGGCGLGRWLFFLSRREYTNLIGVDFINPPLDIIKKNNHNIKVRVGNVDELPINNASIDLYLSMGVIEHFEEGPQKSLNEAMRVLKKNGFLIVAVPYQNLYRGTIRKYVTMPLLKILKPSFRDKNRIFYQYYYSKRDLRKFINQSGFEIMDWFYYDQYHTKSQRIGISLEFPFTKKNTSNPYELNWVGRSIAIISELFSKCIFSSSIAFVVKKPK